jgi:hypothetical protein
MIKKISSQTSSTNYLVKFAVLFRIVSELNYLKIKRNECKEKMIK